MFSRKICTHRLSVIIKWRITWVICRGLKKGKLIRRILRYIWKNHFFRYFNRFDQIHPIFPDWLTILAAKSPFSANKTTNTTFEIFLPPVPSKVTDPNTIYEHMLYLQSITAKVNMKYAKTTLDVGVMGISRNIWILETFTSWGKTSR